jgi:anti-sigma B factor antagonist
MHVEVRKKGDVVIVDMTGRLVGGIGDEILRNVVNELLAESWKKILLNLSGIAAIDSAGIGELVASLKTANHLGASLRVLNLNERVRTALHLGRLLPLFEVFGDEKAAMQSFGAA